MSPRPLTRIALHLFLVVALVVTGIAAPAQAIAEGLQAVAAASPADASLTAIGDMPCDAADMPVAKPGPCDCCAPRVCDFSACLGTACLPELPRVAAMVPPAVALLPWQAPAFAPAIIDNPLRPPIA